MNRLPVHWRTLTFAGLIAASIAGWMMWRGQRDAGLERIKATGREATSSGHSPFSVPESGRKTEVDRQIAKLNPSHDGWDSEVVSGAIDQQLGRLRDNLQSDSTTDFPAIVADNFVGQTVDIDALRPIFADAISHVERLPDAPDGRDSTNSLSAVFDSWGDSNSSGHLRCSFKIIDIEVAANEATTRILVERLQSGSDELLQSNAVCQCRWQLTADEAPRLTSWEVEQYERARLAAQARPLFEDVTENVLGKTDSYGDQILRGVDYWSERLTGLDDMHLYGHHGLAVGDVDNNGLDDLYVCDSGGLPNRLYLQQPDGTVRDASEASKADWLEASTCALLIDLDNDGDQDLVVATVAAILFAANDGAGHFQIRGAHPGMPEAHSLCAADYDNDGDLDLYVPNYGPGGAVGGNRGFEASLPIPYHDAQNGGRNALLENQGNWKFVDVTQGRGLEMNNRRWSFSASWEDYDHDGDQDLYVANDFGRNNLYRNEGGQFRDVAADLDVEDMAAGMSVSWGDFNRDGRMDLYVGNMFSAAGNRVTYQRRFLEGRSATDSAGVQRMARGNTLFMAQPDGSFADVSLSAGVTMGRWAWSSKFADLNNDGWEDLVVANGYFTNEKQDDL